MSTESILARLSLLHLKDSPDKLDAELYRRILIHDDRTREEIEEDNLAAIRRGKKGVDIDKYVRERELAKTSDKETQK